MKIIVFGKNGQVGSALCRLLDSAHEVIALDKEELDLCDSAAINECIVSRSPDWVVNCSAYTAVDNAEADLELAQQLNEIAPAEMAAACEQMGAAFLHYSTDYVFDGNATVPYLENDKPNPKSVYGITKLAGERAVMAACPTTIILRTAWVYSKEGKNFVNTMLRLATQHDQLTVVADQFGSPTLASDLAEASVAIISSQPQAEAAGIYHATGKGATNWHEFASEIFRLRGLTVEVIPVTTEQYPTAAPRPAYSVLCNDKLKANFGIELPDWQQSLARTLS